MHVAVPMKKLKSILFLDSFDEVLPESDLVARQRLRLFRITRLLASLVFTVSLYQLSLAIVSRLLLIAIIWVLFTMRNKIIKKLFDNITPGSRFTWAKQIFYLLFVCLQVFPAVSFSQQQDIKFEYLGIEAGLSNSDVYCVLQDSRGFMWVGTSDGLNKYDGYKFTVYKNDPSNQYSLNNNSILNIVEDSKGIVWLGTWGGGLNKFDREKNRFIHFKHDPQNNKSISSDFITSLLQDKHGNLWIGTQNGELDLLDRSNNQFIHYSGGTERKPLNNAFITTIYEDSRDNLWIGTIGGLKLFDRNDKTFTKYLHAEKSSKSLCNNSVNVIYEDSRKNLWVGTNDGGLDQFDKKTGEFSHFRNNLRTGNSFPNCDVRAIMEDDQGSLWIGTRNGGLCVFNPVTGISQNYHQDELDVTSLRRNSIMCIYKDPKGNVWIGTTGGGINFLNKAGEAFTHYKHNSSPTSLSDNDVTGIYEDSDKNLWIGTDGGGLNLFDRKSGRFIHYRHQANDKNSICGNNILGICEDSKGNLWIGTWGEGITVFNRKKNTFRHFRNDPAKSSSLSGNNAWTIFKDRENNIWVGAYGGGLNLYNPGNDSFTHYEYDEKNPSGINNNNVITIFEDSKGLLWIGTDGGGLNQFDKKTNKFIHFTHDDFKNSLSYNFVSEIFEDRAGNLYLATGTGLNYFNTRTRQFTFYTVKDGFTAEAVTGILPGAGDDLWMSTAKGVSHFDPATKKVINFNTEDGLHPNNYTGRAYCKSSTGAMYFGGTNGFDSFFPDRVKKISFDPPIVITDFQVFNKEVRVAIDEKDSSTLKDITETKKITLPYSSSVISFEFASLHYGVRERKQYAYMLEGFDKTWNEVGTQRTATYTNLDPGKYVFKVKGLKNEETWSSNIASLQLTITPPFWSTWWFRIFAILVVAASITGFFLVRINAVKRQKRILQQKVKEQTVQLVYSNEEERKARLEADHANEELEKKNQELEQFVYIASHDLREPLRTTSSFVELFQKQYKGKLDQKADTYLSYITQAADRMKTLIDDLLDYSRIGNNKELQKVDCNVILEEVLADLGIALAEAGTQIKSGTLPVINGHPTAIKQLFQNLIANGTKFRKKDVVPVIRINTESKDDHWKFSFSDNGIGIEKQHTEKVFSIFQRLHTRKEYEGSGIGLAHCKKIVELHNGKIWIESAPGEGSTFYFTIHKNNN
jgi:ligand-binding sensor domain-containing protein/signal transduction histidine kinase